MPRVFQYKLHQIRSLWKWHTEFIHSSALSVTKCHIFSMFHMNILGVSLIDDVSWMNTTPLLILRKLKDRQEVVSSVIAGDARTHNRQVIGSSSRSRGIGKQMGSRCRDTWSPEVRLEATDKNARQSSELAFIWDNCLTCQMHHYYYWNRTGQTWWW